MQTSHNEQPSIVATLVPEEDRLTFLPRHFGTHMLTVENFLYAQFTNLCPTYTGGYWHFYDLGNGGCYLAPSRETYSLVHADNFFEATVSGDAAGIIVSLFTFSHLSFRLEDDPLGPRIAQYFHLLRDFAADHPEAGLIARQGWRASLARRPWLTTPFLLYQHLLTRTWTHQSVGTYHQHGGTAPAPCSHSRTVVSPPAARPC